MTTTRPAAKNRMMIAYCLEKKTCSSEVSVLKDFFDEQYGVCGLLGPGHHPVAVDSVDAP